MFSVCKSAQTDTKLDTFLGLGSLVHYGTEVMGPSEVRKESGGLGVSILQSRMWRKRENRVVRMGQLPGFRIVGALAGPR